MALVHGLMVFATMYFGIMSVVVNPLLILTLRRLSEPEKLMEVVENGPEVMSAGGHYDAVRHWVQDHEFSPEMLIHFRCELGGKATVFAVWRSQSGHDFLCDVKAPALTYTEFVTTLGEDSDLTTSNAKLAMMLPTAPHRYVQAFSRLPLDDLFQRHIQGLEHLRNSIHLAPIQLAKPADRLVAESVRSQANHIRSLPLWQLRSTWWYWMRRNLLHKKTIAERYPHG